MNNFHISTNKSLLDIKTIQDFLNNDSYWAKGRSLEIIERSIANSLCFGVYDGKKQVGFARIVTDYSVFAWVMDVFILKEYQKKGLGKQLMDSIVNYKELGGIKRWGLSTDDAHGLYQQYGFSSLEKPEMFMERLAK